MDPREWERIEDVFQYAIDLHPAERAGYLDHACNGDPSLRRCVESLLVSASETGRPIHNALAEAAGTVVQSFEAAPGTRFGPYEIVRKIGEGGMGTVYLAIRADEAYQRQVAIKVVRSALNQPRFAARFLSERRILASLDHPNIARLLDGGSGPAGEPYVVMEFVEGVPIDEFCRQRQLSIPERLRLFLQVCDAASAAHHKLIIHRDIKAANVLVTADGVAKLLDFGIARLVAGSGEEAAAGNTRTNERLLTPEYASPEQIRGEPLGIATDVYSLGVLLYELLADHYPFERARSSPLDLQVAICEDEPPRPSTRCSRDRVPVLAGDLDNITLKALRKEPVRRYASCEAFAEDIRRHLAGYPVAAAAGSWRYRAGKFLRRNRLGAAAAVVVAVLIAGWVVSLRIEQERLRERFAEVREMAESFLFRFDESIRDVTGATAARKLVVSEGLKYLSRLAAQSAGDAGLQEELADAYGRIAAIQFGSGSSHLGDLAGAEHSLQKQREILEPLVASRPALRRKLATCYGHLATTLGLDAAQASSAHGFEDKEAAILDGLIRDDASNPDNLHDLSRLLLRRSARLLRAGKPREALAPAQRAVELLRTLTQLHPADDSAKVDYAKSLFKLGDALGGGQIEFSVGDRAGALRNYRGAQAILEPLHQRAPENSTFSLQLAYSHSYAASTLGQAGDRVGALGEASRSLALLQDVADRDPANAGSAREVFLSYLELSHYQIELNRLGEAEQGVRHALALSRQVLAKSPRSLQAQSDVASIENDYAEMLNAEARPAEAVPHLTAALGMWKSLRASDPKDALYPLYEAMSLQARGGAYLALHQRGEAGRDLSSALAKYRGLAAAGQLPAGSRAEIAKLEGQVGSLGHPSIR